MLHKQTLRDSWRVTCQKMKSAVSLLLILPLIECAAMNATIAKREAGTPEAKTSMTATDGNFRCTLATQENIVFFDSRDGALHLHVKLDMPNGVDLSNPIFFFCGERITVIATPRYLARSLGHWDATQGRLMLGMLGDKFYPQNMVVLDMKPLGRIKKVDFFALIKGFHGNEAAVETMDGKFYRIDLDSPTTPAKEL